MYTSTIRFGIIGGGLMGKEFASAVARWFHLNEMNVKPEIVGICDTNEEAIHWFKKHLPTVQYMTSDYQDLIHNPDIDAIYCAIPHHLHEKVYIDTIKAGKHLLGEKPFGINYKANQSILQAMAEHPEVIVRCSSEMPFYPGAYHLYEYVQSGKVGKIIDVEAGFWHSSDLNPLKPINWKRKVEFNGEYGCMGDLGMHVLHLPLRFGWRPVSVKALLSNLVEERPNHMGEMVPCKTWDNAILACDMKVGQERFPAIFSMKRIAPGHENTWFIKVNGMNGSIEYSTQNPKQIKIMDYQVGGNQEWRVLDIPYRSAYSTITGSIFEFGFSDAILQMWAAFCDEVFNRKQMQQPLHCATPEESELTHQLFTAALQSQKTGTTISLV